MPPDDVLPPPHLPPLAREEQIVRHFPAAFGVRIDVGDVDALPPHITASLTGVRLPEPPEAVLLDRVLQVVPAIPLRLIERILIADAGVTGLLGVYSDGVIRLGTDALQLRRPDRQFAGVLSVFTATVLHEIGHAVYRRLLTPAQRFAAEDLYLAFVEEEGEDAEPSAEEAEHHLLALFVAGVAGIGYGPFGLARVREMLKAVGVPLR
jgi:hypothetical protein